MKIIKRVLTLAVLCLMCGTVASAAEGWNVGDIFIMNQNNAEGTFQIQISDAVGLDNVKEIKAAVWSEEDGQDDLRWYEPVMDGTGNGVINVSVRDHNYALGKYNVHVYVWDQNGNSAVAGGAWCYFNPVKSSPVVTSIREDRDYQLDLAGVELPAGAGEIRYAVWSSENGQDDLLWYPASRQENGNYSAQISVDSHKGYGQYEVHAYAFSKGGHAYFLGSNVFSTNMPSIGTMEALNNRIKKDSFSIKFDQVENADLIRELQVAVWSGEDGQDDLTWYSARKLSDGTYMANVNIEHHNYSVGTYFAHAYITDRTGYQYFAGSIEKNLEVKQGKISVDERGLNCEVTLEGSEAPGGAKNVSFAVWSEKDGQNDLQWYDGKLENGAYVADVSMRNLKSLGDYNIHAYITMKNEKMVFAGGEVFTTAEPRVRKVVVDSADREKGKFRIRLSQIEHAELLREIQVPVWSREDQSDITWYTAIPDGTGSHIVDVDIKDHQYNSGIYTAHVYVTDISGNTVCTGGTECDMAILYSSLQVEDLDGTETSFRAELKGAKVPGGAKSVQFAVWGDDGGQNDLTWYTATLQNDGTYTADIKVNNHKEIGTYYIDVYAVSRGETHQWIASRTFTIDKGAGIPSGVIEQIKYYVGVPYVSGGTAPTGWDCSGFTYWVYQNYFEMTIGRTTFEQVEAGVAVYPFDMDAWLPGDLIFYSPNGNTLGHVALYLGDGLIMHALNPARGTFIQSAEEYARWDGLPVAVRRVLD